MFHFFKHYEESDNLATLKNFFFVKIIIAEPIFMYTEPNCGKLKLYENMATLPKLMKIICLLRITLS